MARKRANDRDYKEAQYYNSCPVAPPRSGRGLHIALAVVSVLSVLFILAVWYFLRGEESRNREQVSLHPIIPRTETAPTETLALIQETESQPDLLMTTAPTEKSHRVERRIEREKAMAVMAEMNELLDKGKSVDLGEAELSDYQLGEMNDVQSQMGEIVREQVQKLQAQIPQNLNIQIQEDTVEKTYDLPLSAAFEMGNFQDTGVQLWVFAEIANIRQDADINAPKLGEAVRGDFVWEVSSNGIWSYVIFQDGTAGYIYKELLREVEIEHEKQEVVSLTDQELNNLTPLNATLYSNNSGVRIRKEPTTDSEIIGELYYGDSIQCLAYGIDWYQVQLPSGEIGYIYSDYVQFDPVEAVDLVQEGSGEQITDYEEFVDQNEWYQEETPVAQESAGGLGLVNLALQHVGKPYVLGACGPDAFDCSGFVQFLLGQMGVSVGRTTYDQVHAGSPVNWNGNVNNLLPGDIILLGQGGDIYHSMIYIGNGQIVHAGTPATGVNVDKLEWYMPQIAHVRRIFY